MLIFVSSWLNTFLIQETYYVMFAYTKLDVQFHLIYINTIPFALLYFSHLTFQHLMKVLKGKIWLKLCFTRMNVCILNWFIACGIVILFYGYGVQGLCLFFTMVILNVTLLFVHFCLHQSHNGRNGAIIN